VTRAGGAVLGSPVTHSLSPVLHRAAYAELGLPDWDYRAVECTSEQLPATLRALEAEGLAGVSLTMPLKRGVVPLLSRVDRLAADLGVVNTVLFGGEEGTWWGTNTDVPGIVAALRGANVALRPDDVAWVVGAGATATSAIAALGRLGIGNAVLVARRPDTVTALVRIAMEVGVDVEVRGWGALPGCNDAPLVVSTVPAGATDEFAVQVAAPAGMLLDVVYHPWPTRLATAWRRGGAAVVGGLELLVEQAAEQVRLMTGQQPPVDAMRAAGQAALAVRAID
jgi:shikimate dehydrogenase